MSTTSPMDTLNTTQAAEALKVHPKTVEDLIHEGYIPAAKVGRASQSR